MEAPGGPWREARLRPFKSPRRPLEAIGEGPGDDLKAWFLSLCNFLEIPELGGPWRPLWRAMEVLEAEVLEALGGPLKAPGLEGSGPCKEASKVLEGPWRPLKELKVLEAPWRPWRFLEAPGSPWRPASQNISNSRKR